MKKLLLTGILATLSLVCFSQKRNSFEIATGLGASLYNINNSNNLVGPKTFLIPTSSFNLGFWLKENYNLSLHVQSWNFGKSSNDSISRSGNQKSLSLRLLCLIKNSDKWEFMLGPEMGVSRIFNSYKNQNGNESLLKFTGNNFGLYFTSNRILGKRFSLFYDLGLVHHHLKGKSFTLDGEQLNEINNIAPNNFRISIFGLNNRIGLRLTM
ncbi:MAG: hypothetical protein ACK4K0_10415 [Flavobacteriales bacterium]